MIDIVWLVYLIVIVFFFGYVIGYAKASGWLDWC
jgi:hypothetical protein